MNPLHRHLHTEVEHIRLTAREKRQMRAALFGAPVAGAPSPYRFYLIRTTTIALSLVAIVLVLTSGTALAAQSALPGDLLYPVKTGVTEQIQTALAFSPAAKAQVHAALAARRLEEAQSLAASGRLDATTTALLAANFDAQTEAAQSQTSVVAQSDPSEAAQLSVEIASNLSANGAVLADLAHVSKDPATRDGSQTLARAVTAQVGSMGTSTPLLALVPAVSSSTAVTSTVSAAAATSSTGMPEETSSLTASSTVSSAPAATSSATTTAHDQNTEKLLARFSARANAALSEAQAQYAGVASQLSTTTSAQASSTLQSIADELSAANAAQTAGESREALGDYTRALGDAVSLKALIDAAARLNSPALVPLIKVQISGDAPTTGK